MERLLYVSIGGLLLGDRTAEYFRPAYQFCAGFSLHVVHDLTAHCLLRRIGKEGKPRKASMYSLRRTCAPLALPSQISPKEAVQEHSEHDQGDDDVGAIALLCEGKDRECHPRDRRRNEQQEPKLDDALTLQG
jgi:hypothetical protein